MFRHRKLGKSLKKIKEGDEKGWLIKNFRKSTPPSEKAQTDAVIK